MARSPLSVSRSDDKELGDRQQVRFVIRGYART